MGEKCFAIRKNLKRVGSRLLYLSNKHSLLNLCDRNCVLLVVACIQNFWFIFLLYFQSTNMSFERRLPLLRTDFSVIDREFSSIREKFDQEMKLMEEEMNRFRSQLLDREMPRIQSHSTATGSDGQTTHRSEVRTWLDGLNSPLIQDSDDGKRLRLRFDVSQYQPEEIVVKTVDNKLQVQAKHEEKTDTKSVYREYNREFLLPKGTNPEMIKSSLSTDGVLTVEAPLPALESGVHMIPIENK